MRHSARTLMALANADVPMHDGRAAQGLRARLLRHGLATPSSRDLLVGWPTAEFGGMGLEGAVNIVFREELEAAPDEETRKEHPRRADRRA